MAEPAPRPGPAVRPGPALPPAPAVRWLGRVPYAEALELQAKAAEALRAGSGPETLLLLEHPPVVTLGRSHRPEHLLEPPDTLLARGVEVHAVARGGDVTWHGPGQLVGYPILDLAARERRDVHVYLRDLEALLVEALAELGVAGETRPGMTGVFAAESAPPRKIASIGVGVRGWVTTHGFALNVSPDLAGFGAIVPCGLHGVEMTSVARELASGESAGHRRAPAHPDDRRDREDRQDRADRAALQDPERPRSEEETLPRRAREAVAGAFLRRFS